jgi:Peptidase family M1 domain
MLRFARYALAAVSLAGVCTPLSAQALGPPQVRQGKPPAIQATPTPPAPTEPRALYQALNALRPDPDRVYSVKSLTLRRDVINFNFEDGKLAFLQSLGGRITGLVFAGRGHAIAIPHDPGERRSVAQFTGVPILDQAFSRAYLRFDDGTAEEIASQLARAGETATTDTNFAENWDPIFANTNPWHSLRIMEDWLSTAPRPYFYAGILTDAEGMVDLMLDQRREEQVLFGQPRRMPGGTFVYDVWASFRALDAPQNPAEAFASAHYKIVTKIADDLSLDGTTLMDIKALRGGDRVVPLELSRKLAVEDVKDGNGTPLVYFQNEDLSKRQIEKRGNDTVLVVLPAPVQEGQALRLEISYHGSVISDAGNGVEYVGEHETWYAHPSGLGDFASFDLSFRWPKRFTLVATGKEVESHDDGDFESGRWVSDAPFAVAGFNLGEYRSEVANASRPRIELYANHEIESAILARLQQQHPVVIPARPELAPFRTGQLDALPSTPPPDPVAVLKNLGGQILDAIHFYENLNGPFPFASLDVSQIPGRVGQGWPGLVYLSTFAFLPAEAEQHVGITEQAQEMARELMPFHEVAHQWWGNVTAAATYRDVWIQEGMANYLAMMYSDARKPVAHRLHTWLERYRAALIARAPQSGQTVETTGPLTLGYRLAASSDPEAYNAIIYGKGAWVMHMIREMLRDPVASDPDARFRRLLQSILTEYRFQPLSTADFQRAVEAQMTPSMDLEGDHTMNWFFSEWVENTGIPDYSVQFEAKLRRHEFVVSGTLKQANVNDLFTAPVPLYGERSGRKPERLGVVVTMGAETKFRFVSRFRPTRLVIDPELTVLHGAD